MLITKVLHDRTLNLCVVTRVSNRNVSELIVQNKLEVEATETLRKGEGKRARNK